MNWWYTLLGLIISPFLTLFSTSFHLFLPNFVRPVKNSHFPPCTPRPHCAFSYRAHSFLLSWEIRKQHLRPSTKRQNRWSYCRRVFPVQWRHFQRRRESGGSQRRRRHAGIATRSRITRFSRLQQGLQTRHSQPQVRYIRWNRSVLVDLTLVEWLELWSNPNLVIFAW